MPQSAHRAACCLIASGVRGISKLEKSEAKNAELQDTIDRMILEFQSIDKSVDLKEEFEKIIESKFAAYNEKIIELLKDNFLLLNEKISKLEDVWK